MQIKNISGGSLIFLKSDLLFKQRKDIENLSVEFVIEISATELSDFKIVIVTMYRPPSDDIKIFYDRITAMLDILNREENNKIIVMRDFNISVLDITKQRDTFVDIFNSYNMQFLFSEASREITNNCIDNVFMNKHDFTYTTETINIHVSDHLAQKVTISLPSLKMPKKQVAKFTRIYSEKNIKHLVDLLNEVKFPNRVEAGSPFREFHATFLYLFESCFPRIR